VNITINEVAIDADGWPSRELAAVRELLRQRAVAIGLLDADAHDDAATAAIEQLLAREVITPSPTEEECRRYYDAHAEEFRSGDLVCARHILFQVTPGCNVDLVRAEAEET
jgi:peptidyl-prolyl cis-trans isomerase C